MGRLAHEHRGGDGGVRRGVGGTQKKGPGGRLGGGWLCRRHLYGVHVCVCVLCVVCLCACVCVFACVRACVVHIQLMCHPVTGVLVTVAVHHQVVPTSFPPPSRRVLCPQPVLQKRGNWCHKPLSDGGFGSSGCSHLCSSRPSLSPL